jgi:hypothetical protein
MQNLQPDFSCLGWVWVAGKQALHVTSGATLDATFTMSNSARDYSTIGASCLSAVSA